MNDGLLIAKDIWRSHPNYLGDDSVALQHEEVFEAMAHIFCPGPSFYYVIDSPSLTFDYVSPDIAKILGISSEGLDLQRMVSTFHPEELDFFLRCEDVVAYFLKNIVSAEKICQYKIVSSLRHLLPDGKTVILLKQTMVTKSSASGALLKVLGIHSDIGHITQSPSKTLSFIGLAGEPSYMDIDVFSANVFEDFTPFQYEINNLEFTKRELDVIRLLARGGSTNQIANTLNISAQTVQTHRKNILKKAPVRNSAELIEYCIRRCYL